MEQGKLIADRYELGPLIGRGGMGEVYRGRDLRTATTVALKILRNDLSSPSLLRRFQRECAVLAQLNHPGIVRVIEVLVTAQQHYLVMEYVAGGSLADRMLSGRPMLAETLRMAEAIADALAHVHTHQIVHRDIKPANVLITEAGLPRITDFGLVLIADQSRLTSTGTVMGTAPYLCPEGFRGERLDMRADVWAFGVLLYELLAGRRPFLGQQPPVLMAAIMNDEPPPLAQFNPAVSPALADLTLRMLVKDREQRLSSMREIATALAAFSTNLPLPIAQGVPATIVLPEHDGAVASTGPTLRPAVLPSLPSLPHTPALIGRAQALDELGSLLLHPETRLLSLTGPGGTGKTSVALTLANRLSGFFADGVAIALLSPLSDAALVGPTLAAALHVDIDDSEQIEGALCAAVAGRNQLLVVDNFEQLLAAAPLVGALVAAAPSFKVLATSRERLGLAGEIEFPIAPLAAPERAKLATNDNVQLLSQVAASPAVQLFVQRAQAIRPDFALSAANARAVGSICMRLDGLPLAIELAAARIKLLSPEAMLKRLDQRLALLVGGPRNRDLRQQTLRAAIDWSYALLNETERQAFAQLAVCVGGCDLEAGEAILAATAAEEPLELLLSLVQKSLLRQHELPDGTVRLTMLETIREYAIERFTADPAQATVREAHALHYLARAEQAQQAGGSEYEQLLANLDRDLDNLRTALQWALDRNELLVGLRLGGALWHYWFTRGLASEGRRWLGRVLDKAQSDASQWPQQPQAALALALHGAGTLAYVQGEYEQAVAHFEQALPLWRALQDQRGQTNTLVNLGNIHLDRGERDTARQIYEEALALQRVNSDRLGISITLNNLGNLAFQDHDLLLARSCYHESLALARALEDTAGIVSALTNLGGIANLSGNYGEAEKLFQESLALARKLNDSLESGLALSSLGVIAAEQGQTELALQRLREGIELLRTIGNQIHMAEAMGSVAGVTGAAGNTDAAQLWSAIDHWRSRTGTEGSPIVRERQERWIIEGAAACPPELWQAAWQAGKMLTLDEAAVLALRLAQGT